MKCDNQSGIGGIHPLSLPLCIKLNGVAAAAVVGGQMAFADIRPPSSYQPFRSAGEMQWRGLEGF